MVGADVQHGRERRKGQILVHVVLLNDLQCAFAQAAGLSGVRRKADAALALRRRAQGLDRLFVGIVQVTESGKFTLTPTLALRPRARSASWQISSARMCRYSSKSEGLPSSKATARPKQ